MKKTLLAIVAVFILWAILDYLLHGVILMSVYSETPELWRPMEEMRMGLMYVVSFIFTACFITIYAAMISDKGMKMALQYGFVFGTGVMVKCCVLRFSGGDFINFDSILEFHTFDDLGHPFRSV